MEKNKIENDNVKFEEVTCDSMDCKNCKFKTEETSSCELYDVKPDRVLLGKDCKMKEVL